jgi:NAD(P)-dependent dehydrogenase (short-subunit alcohol dehydrogenase family)
MTDEVAIVTGATGALGEATATGLARLGWSVVLGCRDETRGNQARSRISANAPRAEVVVRLLDLSSPESIRAMVASFADRYRRLDALVHTAALFSSSHKVTPEGWELMFATNHLGPFLLTRLLLETQAEGRARRILVVTAPSTTQVDFDDPQGERRFRALWAFGASKMCNLLFTYALARRLKGTSTTVNAFHPGLVKSGLMKEAPTLMRLMTNAVSRPPGGAAASLVALAASSRYATVSGMFFKGEQVIQSSAYSLDSANQERLWALSSRLVGLPP